MKRQFEAWLRLTKLYAKYNSSDYHGKRVLIGRYVSVVKANKKMGRFIRTIDEYGKSEVEHYDDFITIHSNGSVDIMTIFKDGLDICVDFDYLYGRLNTRLEIDILDKKGLHSSLMFLKDINVEDFARVNCLPEGEK